MKPALLFLLLTSCTVKQGSDAAFEWPVDRKQRQKIAFYHKKLESAERALSKTQEEVDLLRHQIWQAELKAIETQVKALEERWKGDPYGLSRQLADVSLLFIDERETLHRITQDSPFAPHAQQLLDRILQLITQLSDSEVRMH
jgi:DNA repair exonuclease SbcCD ATPase subunit